MEQIEEVYSSFASLQVCIAYTMKQGLIFLFISVLLNPSYLDVDKPTIWLERVVDKTKIRYDMPINGSSSTDIPCPCLHAERLFAALGGYAAIPYSLLVDSIPLA